MRQVMGSWQGRERCGVGDTCWTFISPRDMTPCLVALVGVRLLVQMLPSDHYPPTPIPLHPMQGRPATQHRPQAMRRKRQSREVIEISSDDDGVHRNLQETVKGLRKVRLPIYLWMCISLTFSKEVASLLQALQDKDRLIKLLSSQAAVSNM